MHEFSLIQSMLDIVEDYAAKHGFERVNAIQLSFGRLSCIEPKALEFGFKIQSEGTKAKGAALEFDILPVVVYCLDCENESHADHWCDVCPTCKSENVMLNGGMEELRIISLDVI